jgi:hypothetical protein
VQVDRWPGIPTVHDFTALVMHTDMKRRDMISVRADPGTRNDQWHAIDLSSARRFRT